MPILKNTARQITVSVRLSGSTDGPYVTATWPDSAVAKMYYSKDGATPVAVIPTRIDATLGGWLLAVGTMTSSVWNCDELRVFWEGTGILSGSISFYPEAEYTSTVAGRIDAAISSRSTLAAADVRTAVGLASANLDTQLSTIAGYLDTEVAAILAAVDTEVAAIKAKTDNLPTDPADASDIAASFASITTLLNTLSGYVDTEVAAILAAVDTEVAAIKAKTDNIPASPAAVGSAMTLAADSVTASALATDAVAEIQSGLSTLTAAGVRTAVGLASANLDTQIAAVQSDTDDIQTRLPAALVSGRMDSSVGAMAANTLTASALATDAVAEIADGVWDEALAGHATAGTAGDTLSDAGSSSTVVRLMSMPLRSGRTEPVRYTRGAEGPDLLEHLIDGSGSRINLTGYTITASLIRVGTEAAIFTAAAASLGNAPEEGQVVLDWPTDSLDTPGQYRLIWTATKSGADTLTWQTLVVVE